MAAGDTIEFTVGWGSNADFSFDSTGLTVTIAPPASSAQIHWLVTDQLGTPRMIFDQSGSLSNVSRHDYLPFGEEVPFGFRNGIGGY